MTESDSAASLAIWNDGRWNVSAELFAEKVWQDDDITNDLRLMAMSAAGEATGFVVATARSTAPGGGCLKMLAVTPQARRQGIATQLLNAVEAQFRRDNLTTIRLGESPPNYLQPGVDSDDQSGMSFFARRGFVQFGTVHDMTCQLDHASLDTSADEKRLEEDAIVVRRAALEDREQIGNLLGAFWPTWRPEVAVAFDQNPKSVHVAVVDNPPSHRVIGFAAHSTNNQSVGWFGPMGTDPAFRGTGVGTVLLKRCLHDLRTVGFTEATIPWVGPVEFYTRTVGAHVARTYHRFEKKLD